MEFNVTLEPFENSKNYYYLTINGEVVAVLIPSDFTRLMNMLGAGVSNHARARVAAIVDATYRKEAL